MRGILYFRNVLEFPFRVFIRLALNRSCSSVLKRIEAQPGGCPATSGGKVLDAKRQQSAKLGFPCCAVSKERELLYFGQW